MDGEPSIEELIAERKRLAVEMNGIMQRIDALSAKINAHVSPSSPAQLIQQQPPPPQVDIPSA